MSRSVFCPRDTPRNVPWLYLKKVRLEVKVYWDTSSIMGVNWLLFRFQFNQRALSFVKKFREISKSEEFLGRSINHNNRDNIIPLHSVSLHFRKGVPVGHSLTSSTLTSWGHRTKSFQRHENWLVILGNPTRSESARLSLERRKDG